MRKLSDIRGEEALDVLADLLKPATDIMVDKEIVKLARSGDRVGAVSIAIKNHKDSVISILAILEGADPSKYEPSLMELPIKLLEILNDPDLVQVFTSQGQMQEENASGSAMGSTEETEND